FFSSRRRHTRFSRDWSSDVCSSDLGLLVLLVVQPRKLEPGHSRPIGRSNRIHVQWRADPKQLCWLYLLLRQPSRRQSTEHHRRKRIYHRDAHAAYHSIDLLWF